MPRSTAICRQTRTKTAFCLQLIYRNGAQTADIRSRLGLLRRKTMFSAFQKVAAYPYRLLRSNLMVVATLMILVMGTSLDTTQSIYLYYTNRAFFLSMEQNQFTIYLLRAGYWFVVVIWEALFAGIGIVLVTRKRLVARFFAFGIALASIVAPLTWWLGAVLSLAIFSVALIILLLPLMFKTWQLSYGIEAKDRWQEVDWAAWPRILRTLLCLSA